MVVCHIDIVILDIDMGYGLMIWEMTASIRSSPISIWDILSLRWLSTTLPQGCTAVRRRGGQGLQDASPGDAVRRDDLHELLSRYG